MSDYSKLQELAEAATAGPWVSSGNWVSTLRGNSIADCSRGDEEFIAAANPSTVLALLAEVERLRTAEGDAMTYKAGMENVAQQRDQLKAEVEELTGQLEYNDEQVVALEKQNKALMREYEPMRKNAERYQHLRKAGLVLEGHDFISFGEIADYRIDVAMGKGE
jgi:septal ring factor EnvC (AmiA/AmiB activator)